MMKDDTLNTPMLNLFPIQFLAPFAYMLLRICLGLVLMYLGKNHFRARHSLAPLFSFRLFPFGHFFAWYLTIVEIIIGIFLFVGLYTQVAALLTMILSLKFIIMHKRFTHPTIPSRLSYLFMFVIATSLCITGAGIFAFDLPI